LEKIMFYNPRKMRIFAKQNYTKNVR